jgi:monoamine oxidase
MRSEPRCDVVVVGAGAAGLAAARTLSAAGRTVAVVEARERVGGRALTLSWPGLAAPLELGPEFVHGRAPVMQALLAAAGIVDVDVSGSAWEVQNGRLEPRDDVFAGAQRLIERAGSAGEPDESVDAFLRRFASDPALVRGAERVRLLVCGFDAADPARASIRAIAEEWRGDASLQAGESRPVGGYGPLFRYLAAQLDPQRVRLLLRFAVDEIRRGPDGVAVSGVRFGEPARVEAAAAIVTLPIGVLQQPAGTAGAVRFSPDLPVPTRTAIAAIAAGDVAKVLLHFHAPFWEELEDGRFRDGGFFNAPGAAFPTVWTSAPAHQPVLTAWCGGPPARELLRLGEERLVARALAHVTALFGLATEPPLLTAHVHDWTSDAYARGAYSYLLVGGEGARETLAEPVDGRVFFAGEAAAPAAHAGTVAGAVQSGIDAATALLAGAL